MNVADPVCGMTVDPATAAGSSTHGDRTYYFCSLTCQQRFDASPADFVERGAGEQPAGRVHRGLRRRRG